MLPCEAQISACVNHNYHTPNTIGHVRLSAERHHYGHDQEGKQAERGHQPVCQASYALIYRGYPPYLEVPLFPKLYPHSYPKVANPIPLLFTSVPCSPPVSGSARNPAVEQPPELMKSVYCLLIQKALRRKGF
jgi:hypothetical protein